MHFRLIWPMGLWVRGFEDLYWDIFTVRVFWLFSQTPFEYRQVMEDFDFGYFELQLL